MRISLNIVHAPWIEARVASMARLRKALGMGERDTGPHGKVRYAEETTRAPKAWWVWHELQLRWSLEQDVDWCFFGQDDAITPPAKVFWPVLEAMLSGIEYDVVCLHNGHPGARTVFMRDERPGYTTPDGLVGQFYGMKKSVVADLAKWLDEEVHVDRAHKLNEDVLTGLFCMDRGLPIFHPVPTLYDHSLDIPSTNEGYDEHLYRAPQVLWTDVWRAPKPINIFSADEYWSKAPSHLGRFYESLHTYAPIILRDRDRGAALLERYRADECPRAYRRFFHRLTT